MKIRLLFIIMTFLFVTNESSAQSSKRLLKTFVPYQWEIYNTIYNRRYWDLRDNYDYITFDKNQTFKRRYQGVNTSGTWKYNRKKKIVELTITKPVKEKITLKIKKLSRKELSYTSSEEDNKVKMFMKQGEVPLRKTRKRRKQSSKVLPRPKKKKN
ncbi:MAG: lipocalin-like domain-containing protein [Saprospiraceae bacterium]